MSLAICQTLTGRGASYNITKVLKDATVYQARIMSGAKHPGSSTSTLAVLKLQPQGREAIMYNRERGCYEIDGIAQSPHIRALLDLIGHDEREPRTNNAFQPQCMVFEWMDTDLWQLPSEGFRSGSQLPRMVAKSVLKALAVLDDLKGVHTDVNPNNVFVSGASGSEPIVKLGDLGCLIGSGGDLKDRYQGMHIRAPEVWRGIGVFHSTDVWGLGVTLAHWLASKPIFGPSDKIFKDMTEEWCLAKIIRLVGPVEQPVRPEYAEEFAMAEYLERESFVHPETGVKEKFIKVGTIREELEKIPGKRIENRCLEFIESLLVLDHTKRPSARVALEHPWIKGAEDDID